MVMENTKLMLQAFNDLRDFEEAEENTRRAFKVFSDGFFKYLPNPDRKWFQFWKPRKIPNPDYDPEPVEIDIVRGGIKPDKPWPRPDKLETMK